MNCNLKDYFSCANRNLCGDNWQTPYVSRMYVVFSTALIVSALYVHVKAFYQSKDRLSMEAWTRLYGCSCLRNTLCKHISDRLSSRNYCCESSGYLSPH